MLALIPVSADGGDLFQLIVDFGGLQEELCCKIFRQLAEAIQYLHQNGLLFSDNCIFNNCTGIVHRDLKLENIRISPDYKPTVTDFVISSNHSNLILCRDWRKNYP